MTAANPRRFTTRTYKTSLVLEDGPPLTRVSNSKDVYPVFLSIYESLDANQEHFVMLSLDTKNKVYGFKVVHTGGLASSIADPKTIMSAALKLDAAAIIVSHNHPSGENRPSREDMEVSRRLTECGKILGIKVLDHIILGEDGFFSMADAGMMGG